MFLDMFLFCAKVKGLLMFAINLTFNTFLWYIKPVLFWRGNAIFNHGFATNYA